MEARGRFSTPSWARGLGQGLPGCTLQKLTGANGRYLLNAGLAPSEWTIPVGAQGPNLIESSARGPGEDLDAGPYQSELRVEGGALRQTILV